MKTNFLKTSALIGGLMLSCSAFAQDSTTYDDLKPFQSTDGYRRWSIGIHGGALSPEHFYGRNDFTGAKVNIGYGGFFKYQVLHGMGIRADFLRGAFEGTRSRNGAYSSFQTDFNWSGSMNVDINIATINWLHGKSTVIPYITGGAGLMSYSPVINVIGGGAVNYKPDGNINELFFPVGAGLKFTLSKGINLNLGYQMNFVDEDNLDGYSDGNQFDRFSYASAGLEFALGSKDKSQLVAVNPVKVMYDDYVSKNDALTSDLASQKSAMDAALASERSNTASQLAAMQAQLNAALADTDGDGVIDKLDKCPSTPAGVKVDGSGCPLPEARNVTIITEDDRAMVRQAIQNLEFETAKATIRPRSYPSLDAVAGLLSQKNISLKLAGHTDNVGSDAANLKLSKDRAESVKAYLVSKGANPSRIEATGYGESQPIATNGTPAGRQKNRRVEFTIY